MPETSGLLKKLKQRYGELLAGRENDVFSAPILLLSLEIAAMLEHGAGKGGISRQELEETIRSLTLDGLEGRAGHMASYLGNTDPNANRAELEAMIEKLALGNDGAPVPFDLFRERVERACYGLVFTAHPTFTMTRGLTAQLAAQAAAKGGSPNYEDNPDALAKAAETPYSPLDLNGENEFALEAVSHAQAALRTIHEAALDVGRKHYPQDWTKLRPRIATIASWVGFDIDGRKDIGWQVTFAKRMHAQVLQLQSYKNRLDDIAGRYDGAKERLAPLLASLGETIEQMSGFAAFFQSYDPKSDRHMKRLQEQSRLLVESGKTRIKKAEQIAKPVEALLASTEGENLQKELVLLLSDLNTNGLSRVQMHVRINARQLHNKMKPLLSIDEDALAQTHPKQRERTYLGKTAALFSSLEPLRADLGDVSRDKASASRQFKLLQQIVKHVDGESPIRFLIAETESAYTVLSALYLAKQFGVEDHIDISPLFETKNAFEFGTEFFEDLLKIPEFRDYIRKRGRLSIETGYSDAGRLIGPGPAGGSIERLKERTARMLADHGLQDVELVFFDTHGESVGRGGHPESMTKRMEYLFPPHFKDLLAEKGIRYVQETSFQGGDGYIWFMNDDTALAALTRALGYALSDDGMGEDDPYYHDKDAVNAFFSTIMNSQLRLMADPRYGTLLTAYGPDLMHRTGSRPVKRQAADSTGEQKPFEVKEMRAIPQNAILAQMGFLINSRTGLGTAIRENREFFTKMMGSSRRFRTIMGLLMHAASLSDAMILKAYIDTKDPTTWELANPVCYNTRLADRFSAVADQLRAMKLHTDMKEIFDIVITDQNKGERVEGFSGPGKAIPAELALLHAIRLALIQRVFLMATDIQDFSPGHETTREKELAKIFRLAVDESLEKLREIFPVQDEPAEGYDFGEPSDCRNGSIASDYQELNRQIFDPLEQMAEDIKNISFAVANYHRAIG